MLVNKFIILLINIYQKTISPDHGLFKHRHPYGFCRFYPSCSAYSKQAFKEFSFTKAVKLSVIRIIKCNPWHKPQVDKLKINHNV